MKGLSAIARDTRADRNPNILPFRNDTRGDRLGGQLLERNEMIKTNAARATSLSESLSARPCRAVNVLYFYAVWRLEFGNDLRML